jgi:hypothetical protein
MGVKEKDTVFGGGLPGRGVDIMKKKLMKKDKRNKRTNKKKLGRSPGALGGRTPIKTVEDMDITKLRNRATDIANSINIGIGGTMGTLGRKLRNLMDEKGKKEFDDGGVVDMTTEVDVE